MDVGPVDLFDSFPEMDTTDLLNPLYTGGLYMLD